MGSLEKALVVRHREVQPRYYELEFIAPAIAKDVLPGQFVNVRVGDSYDPLLRRPFSIYNVDKKLGSITVFYKVVGRGTRQMARIHIENRLDVMGPLGTPFSIPDGARSVVLVGGGVGIAPLVYLARVLTDHKIDVKVLLGASSAGYLCGKDILSKLGVSLMVSTDDGSEGMKGRVTDLLASELERTKHDFVYACGPERMLARVTEIAEQFGVPGEISLEEHMACGVGACLGCAHRVKQGAEYRYAKVCQEGPVFSIGEVLFDFGEAR
ncbi:MAG: dihydroorotate dehydrogenase electron transfer subunit [Solirubrobacterales bacterium]